MHLLHLVTIVMVLLLTGAELSVAAFVDPSAWRLEPQPQHSFLGHLAAVLGRIMPFWYAACLLLLAAETWLSRHTASLPLLLASTVLWFLATLGSILLLVPLNNHVIAGTPGWQAAHRTWDGRHRVRVALLLLAAILLAAAIVR